MKNKFCFGGILVFLFIFGASSVFAASSTKQVSTSTSKASRATTLQVVSYTPIPHVINNKWHTTGDGFDKLATNLLSIAIASMPDNERTSILAGETTYLRVPVSAALESMMAVHVLHFSVPGNEMVSFLVKYNPVSLAKSVSQKEESRIAKFVEKFIDTLTLTTPAYAQCPYCGAGGPTPTGSCNNNSTCRTRG
jgi:hypothetical protein